jgi:CrcB protein
LGACSTLLAVARALLVAAGGLIGSLARYALTGAVHRFYGGTFPAGTLAVNALGCLAIGWVMGAAEERQIFGPAARVFLVPGLLGGLTTFSAFGYETLQLLRHGSASAALLNVALNVGVGLGAAWLGLRLVRVW